MPNCEYCGAELVHEDSYGRFQGGQMVDKRGEIYRCPNHQGFQNQEEALAFEPAASSWEDVVCESAVHHVSGSFYSDAQGNLHQGYPC